MILAERFVFLHLHKSGGSFVNDCILRHVPGARQVGYHLPRSRVPAACAHLPAIGLVRNPWSYYVSWYSFQRQKPRQNLLFRVLSEDGRLDFSATIHNMLDLERGDAPLARLVKGLPRDYGSQGLNLPGFALAPILGTGLGFYSYLYQYMYAGPEGSLHIGRMEDLPGELIRLLETAGQPVSSALRDHLRQAPPVNRSEHTAYAGFYDQALRDRVATRDAALIAKHGYRFGA